MGPNITWYESSPFEADTRPACMPWLDFFVSCRLVFNAFVFCYLQKAPQLTKWAPPTWILMTRWWLDVLNAWRLVLTLKHFLHSTNSWSLSWFEQNLLILAKVLLLEDRYLFRSIGSCLKKKACRDCFLKRPNSVFINILLPTSLTWIRISSTLSVREFRWLFLTP